MINFIYLVHSIKATDREKEIERAKWNTASFRWNGYSTYEKRARERETTQERERERERSIERKVIIEEDGKEGVGSNVQELLPNE